MKKIMGLILTTMMVVNIAFAGANDDKEYVIIQFSTTFENKQESTETLTMMMDKDRGWRASGYFVK
jgi:hypothetical protein